MTEAEAKATLHRAPREAEALGDRPVREALEVRELDDHPLLLGESRERSGEAGLRGVVVEDARERFLRVLVGDGVGGVGGRVTGGTGAVGLERQDFKVARACSAAGEVDGAAVDDGHDERVQPSVLADAVGALPEREEGSMDGILGGGAVTEDAVREAERAAAVRTVELRERRGVAGVKPTGEFTIIGAWRDVAAPLDGYSPRRGCRITSSREGSAGRAGFEMFGVIQRRSSCESPTSRLREPVPGEES